MGDRVEIFNNIFSLEDATIWITLLVIFIFLKLDFEANKIKEKITFTYVLLLVVKVLDVIKLTNVLLIFFLVTFFFIEIFYQEDFKRKVMNSSKFYIFDYLYKLIFDYQFIYFIISLFFISRFFLNFVSKTKYISLFLDKNILIVFSFFILLRGIKNIFNIQFKTKTFGEIFDKINSIASFREFKYNDDVEKFCKLVVIKEDKSFFLRKKSYNWISYEFIKYKYTRFKLSHYLNIYKLKFWGTLVCWCYIFIKILKLIILRLRKFIKHILKLICHKERINDLFVGHATIEMQLIRTIALEDGYNMTIRRKAYEIIYSTIFFKCLNDYYGYYQYKNYKYFKSYLIYLYAFVAQIKINGKDYKNIFDLYNKMTKDLSFTNEQIYIWLLGLSHISINDEIIDNCPSYVSKNKLIKIIKKLGIKYN